MELRVKEAERLAELYAYGVLDTEFEERFDRLTRVASRVLKAPIALISLVDKERQWFKSSVGLDVRQTPRDISFCTHAIKGKDIFVVLDAKLDSRFSSNPLVTGHPRIRFYAGAPLIGYKGHAIGSLCIIDRKPHREFQSEDRQLLRDIADTIVEILEMRRALSNSQTLKRELRPLAAQLVKLAK